MRVTIALKPESTKPIHLHKKAGQIALASGSLVINFEDGTVETYPLEEIGNLIITREQ